MFSELKSLLVLCKEEGLYCNIDNIASTIEAVLFQLPAAQLLSKRFTYGIVGSIVVMGLPYTVSCLIVDSINERMSFWPFNKAKRKVVMYNKA